MYYSVTIHVCKLSFLSIYTSLQLFKNVTSLEKFNFITLMFDISF